MNAELNLHRPKRTCLGCWKRDDKERMIRLVSIGGVLKPDFQGRSPGRGGYLHPDARCLEGFVRSKRKEFRSLGCAPAREDRERAAALIAAACLDHKALVE